MPISILLTYPPEPKLFVPDIVIFLPSLFCIISNLVVQSIAEIVHISLSTLYE